MWRRKGHPARQTVASITAKVSSRCTPFRSCTNAIVVEDPFTVLSFFVPDPPSRPLLAPLYPSEPPLPAPVSIPPIQEPPLIATLAPQKQPQRPKAKRRHWTITRNALSRARAKDKDEEEPPPLWTMEREPAATDFGTFANLPSLLAGKGGKPVPSETQLFEALRATVEGQSHPPPASGIASDDETVYWNGQAAQANAYLMDVVYGGADGLAYVRSLAEFLTPSDHPVSSLDSEVELS